MYFNLEASKYTLPEEMKMNKMKETNQNLSNIKDKILLDFGQEKIFDLDNSINSLVGCCSLGTGHFDSFIKMF